MTKQLGPTPEQAQKIRSRHIAAYAVAARIAGSRRKLGWPEAMQALQPLARRVAVHMIKRDKTLGR